MVPRLALWLIPLIAFAVPLRAAEPDPEVARYEQELKQAGIETTGPALLKYLRERTLSNEDRARLPDAVKRLGDDDFDTREKAAEELVRASRKALPFLEPATRDADPERARRAVQCVETIKSGAEESRIIAAARLLADRRPDGATVAVLAYLPGAADETVEAELLRALVLVAVKDGKADPAIVKCATDKEPLRRAAAAHVLGRAVPEQRAAVRRLLADTEPIVRFEAAEALVRSGDKEAVPALIALLDTGPMKLGWRAQETLYRIAAEKSPLVTLDDETPAKRARVAEAWRGWWKEAAANTDLAGINLEQRLLGINVICEIIGGGTRGKVRLCRNDKKTLWEINGVNGASDARLLPNGNVLVAEYYNNQITERDRESKIVWTQKVNASPTTCIRLPNGNTFIATFNDIMEVDRKGNKVFNYNNTSGGMIFRARKLSNGNVIFATGNSLVVELDGKAKEVRRITIPAATGGWADVEPLPGNRYLVACYSAGKVFELDGAGKILWECAVRSPTSAVRLPNGNTLISCNDIQTVMEFDRTGKKALWEMKVEGNAFCVWRY